MAILKFADADVQIQVECGKKILHEYSRKTQGDKQECWIASKEDTEFSITCRRRNAPQYAEARMDVYVDGVRTNRKPLEACSSRLRVSGKRISPTEKRPFVFGKPQLEEDGGLQDSERLAMLGTIRVVLMQVKNRKKAGPKLFSKPPNVLPGESSINERAKKAGAHVIKLGPARTTRPSNATTKAEYIPGAPTPSITFRYAPIDFLKARDLVPATFNETGSDGTRTGSSKPGPSASSSRISAVKTSISQPSQSSHDVKPKLERLTGQPSGFRAGEVIDISSDEAPDTRNRSSNTARVKHEPGQSSASVKRETIDTGPFNGAVIELSD